MAEDPGRVEAEIKAWLTDPDAFRDRLLEAGAKRLGSARQVDTYFDHPGRSFETTDEALRIRQESGQAWLTYKGPKLDEATKSREEATTGVEDPDALAAVLAALGFEPAGEVGKKRERFRLDEVTVTVDEVEGLGWFVELEQVVSEDAWGVARDRLLALADALGLEDQERRSYLELLIAKRSEA